MRIDGFVEDLSRSGLFLRAAKLMTAGSSAEIDLDVEGEPRLHLSGEVVRVEHTPQRAGMGLRLIVDEQVRRPLANFIMKLHQALR